MWLRLSLALRTPGGLLQRQMSAREFAEYLALWRLEPWGDARIDIAAATVAATIANHLSPRRRRLVDFLPSWLKPERPRARTPSAMQSLAAQFLAAYRGGK